MTRRSGIGIRRRTQACRERTQTATTTETLPVDARLGSVLINNIRYPVARRVDDNTFTLQYGPQADITTTARWQQFRYLLPVDVGEITDIVDPQLYGSLQRVSTTMSHWWQETLNTDSCPYAWSIFPSSDLSGRWELWLSGSGTTDRLLKYMYRRRNISLAIDELNRGLVAIDSNTATFAESILTANCVGAVLRVSEDDQIPTNLYGRFERDLLTGKELEVLHPPEFEARILEVSSATSAILDRSGSTVAGRAYTISSHIDLNYEGMTELFYRMCEEQYDILTRAEPKVLGVSKSKRMEALRMAMIADGPAPITMPRSVWSGEVILEDAE